MEWYFILLIIIAAIIIIPILLILLIYIIMLSISLYAVRISTKLIENMTPEELEKYKINKENNND